MPHQDITDTPSESCTEYRSEPRFRVKWHATALVDGHLALQGFIKDISAKGAALFLDRYLETSRTITLQIRMPPLHGPGQPHIVEVVARIVYSIHDSREKLFRSGVQFSKFRSHTDQAELNSRLTNHHLTIPD